MADQSVQSNQQANASGRGEDADKPTRIPRSGWKDILMRVKEEQGNDNLSIVAAGVAFYILFSLAPALTALISIYGLFADPNQVKTQISNFQGMVPEQMFQIIQGQVSSIVSTSGGSLGFGLIIGIALALWAAAKGTKSLMTALDIVYNEEEGRGIIKFNAIALLLTLGAIIFMIVSLSFIVALPGLLGRLGLPSILQWLVSIGRWILLAIFIMVGLAVVYRVAPDRDNPKWQWVSLGSVLATIFWIIASFLFSWYVANFGCYNATYGSMGALIILLTWLYLTAYLILIGGEVNSEMEHQTRKDTTRGEPKPMGDREAHVADTTAE